jgi:hypothetical protein
VAAWTGGQEHVAVRVAQLAQTQSQEPSCDSIASLSSLRRRGLARSAIISERAPVLISMHAENRCTTFADKCSCDHRAV